MKVEVEVPEDFMGNVIGDLNSRRGQIEGQDTEQGVAKIAAKIPLAEMFGYATDIRSKTQGRGIFSMEFSHYQEVPKNVAEAIEPKVDEKHPPDKLTPAEPKEFTFAEIEKIVKLVDPLKVLNSLKGANKDSVLRSEARKWREASEMVKSYFEVFDVPQEYTRWLKTVLLTAEMFETSRFDLIEPKLRELDVAWLTFKTDQEVRDSQSRANSKDSE
jgi:hypothetical protein